MLETAVSDECIYYNLALSEVWWINILGVGNGHYSCTWRARQTVPSVGVGRSASSDASAFALLMHATSRVCVDSTRPQPTGQSSKAVASQLYDRDTGRGRSADAACLRPARTTSHLVRRYGTVAIMQATVRATVDSTRPQSVGQSAKAAVSQLYVTQAIVAAHMLVDAGLLAPHNASPDNSTFSLLMHARS